MDPKVCNDPMLSLFLLVCRVKAQTQLHNLHISSRLADKKKIRALLSVSYYLRYAVASR